MFSLFSKSSRFVSKNPSENSDLIRNCSGSIGTLTADREESPSLSTHKNNQFEVKSSVSVNANISETKKYKKKKKKSRSRNFRGLFNSDCEDEINSVVSDNPQLYNRSRSMVSFVKYILLKKFKMVNDAFISVVQSKIMAKQFLTTLTKRYFEKNRN